MRREIVNKGMCATVGRMKILRVLEMRLETERAALDTALDFGLDILAKNSTVKIIRLVRELKERGGNYGSSIRHL
jgi:hypothetical protein